MTSNALVDISIDLENPEFISRYGSDSVNNGTQANLLKQLEASPMRRLADSMSIILKATQMGPETGAVRKQSMVSRLLGSITGATLQTQVDQHLSLRNMPDALEAAKVHAQHLRSFVDTAGQSKEELIYSAGCLMTYLEAGEAYLQTHPDAGLDSGHGIASLSARDRFIRKLANLRALHTSHLLSVEQLKLAVAQATDMLDRYDELVDILLPIYRQHQMAQANRKFLAPHAVELAIKTHEHIQASVSESLKAMSPPSPAITE